MGSSLEDLLSTLDANANATRTDADALRQWILQTSERLADYEERNKLARLAARRQARIDRLAKREHGVQERERELAALLEAAEMLRRNLAKQIDDACTRVRRLTEMRKEIIAEATQEQHELIGKLIERLQRADLDVDRLERELNRYRIAFGPLPPSSGQVR